MAQVALAFVLLVGAGLTVRSVIHLQQVDPGFVTEQVLTARISTNFSRSMEERHDILHQLDEQLGASPFARAAALTTKPPYRSSNPSSMDFVIEGRPVEDTRLMPELFPTAVTRDYFEVLGVPLLDGRTF